MCSPHDGRPTRRPLPQSVLPPAHPSAPGAGDQIKQADRGEPGRGGWAKEGRGYEMDPCRRRCRRSISSSSHPLFRPVVSASFPSPPSFLRLIRRPLPPRAPFRLLVARRLAPSFCYRSALVPFLVPLVVSFIIRRLVPAPRPSTREAGSSPIRWRRTGKQARGRGGAWGSEGAWCPCDGRERISKQAGMGDGQI